MPQTLILGSLIISFHIDVHCPTLDISNYDSRRFTTSGYKEIGIGKFEFVAKTQLFLVSQIDYQVQ